MLCDAATSDARDHFSLSTDEVPVVQEGSALHLRSGNEEQ